MLLDRVFGADSMSLESSSQMLCERCNRPPSKEFGELRILRDQNDWTGRLDSRGPYHLHCAYEEKFWKVELFNTYPRNGLELLYRVITREELPDNREVLFRWLFRSTLTIGFFGGVVSVWVLFYRFWPVLVRNAIIVDLLLSFLLGGVNVVYPLNLIFGEQEQHGDFAGVKRFFRPFFSYPRSYDRKLGQYFSLASFEDMDFWNFFKQLLVLAVYTFFLFTRFVVSLSLIWVPIWVLAILPREESYLLIGALLIPLGIAFWVVLVVIIVELLMPNPRFRSKTLSQILNFVFYRLVKVPFQFVKRLVFISSTGLTNVDCFEMTWEGELMVDDLPSTYYQGGFLLGGSVLIIASMINPRWGFLLTEFLLNVFPVMLFFSLIPILMLVDLTRMFVPSAGDALAVVGELAFQNRRYDGFPALEMGLNLLGMGLVLWLLMFIYRRVFRYVASFMEIPSGVLDLLVKEAEAEYEIGAPEAEKVPPPFGTFVQHYVSVLFQGGQEGQILCQICKQGVRKGVRCPHCGSNYHTGHLYQYFIYASQKRCPLCRREIAPDDLLSFELEE